MDALSIIAICFFIIALIIAIIVVSIVFNNQNRLKRISEKISDGYIIFNKSGRITNYNEKFLKILNIPEKDVKMRNFKDIVKKYFDDEKAILKSVRYFEKYGEMKKTAVNVEKGKKIIRVELLNIVENDVFEKYAMVVRDVTNDNKIIQELKDEQELLKNRERFATLGGLTTEIIHSLKSPIFIMTGELEGLVSLIQEYDDSIYDKTVLPEDHYEIAKDMKDRLGKMKEQMEVISDAISSIRNQMVILNNDEKNEFTIDDLIKCINILMQNTLKQKLIILNFIMKVDKNYKIYGNLSGLVLVLENLILNSVESYDGKSNQIVEISFERKENNLEISVVDYGKGIDKKIQNKIFKEIIYSDDEEKTGLSLFISYSTIKTGFNGDMNFATSSKGTRFNIIIPESKEKN